MNGLEILDTLAKDEIVFKYFGGLMSIDKLHLIPRSRRIFYICNTNLWKNQGKHWIVIHFHDGDAEFFDPLGKKPDIRFLTFMQKYSKLIFFNDVRVQPIGSNVCGEYCIFYASLMSRDMNFQEILKYMKYDKCVIDYVNEMKGV